MSSFTQPLLITPLGHRKWQVKTAYAYNGDSGEQVQIPYDFISDCGSLPQFTWSVVGHPLEDFAQEFILHDRLYFTGEYSRRKSDYIFFEAMQIEVNEAIGMERIRLQAKRYVFYAFVASFFGTIAWEKHRRNERG